MKISICIPTYNRAVCLNNCLYSIIQNTNVSKDDFQVCVSDNASLDHTERVVLNVKDRLNIKYFKSEVNRGRVKNYLSVVDMADGEFIWLLGDDDLLCSDAIRRVVSLINSNQCVDFFYINAFHLDASYVDAYPSPFLTNKLPKNMLRFSSWKNTGSLNFLDLINPRISFDFLGGMFLAVFRRENWMENVGELDIKAIEDMREFSYFDNTFPHVKVFAKAFSNSKAYFHAEPLSVCLTGVREWASMYPFVHGVRLVESLDEYRKNGLPWLQYLRCKNFALNNFIPDLFMMFRNKKNSGFLYVNLWQLIFGNCLYPNVYLSPFYYCARKLKLFITNHNSIQAATMTGSNKETEI